MVKVAPLPEYRGKRDWSKLGLDVEKAGKILPPLAEMYRKRQGIFAGARPPELEFSPAEQVKHIESKEERTLFLGRWLFYIMHFMRGGVKSDTVTRAFLRFSLEHPELLNPDYVVRFLDTERIQRLLQGFKQSALAYKAREHAESWLANSWMLAESYEGNPLLIWKDARDFYQAWRRVDPEFIGSKTPIKGMRKKIFALWAMWLQDYGLVPGFPTPIPVDFHAFRLLFQLEILPHSLLKPLAASQARKEQYPDALIGKPAWRIKEKIRDAVSDFFYDFCVRLEVNSSDLSHALWFLSRMLCARHVQAKVRRNGGIVYFFPERVEKDRALWPRTALGDPCRFCPLENDCSWVVPSHAHYTYGLIIPIRRVEFPRSGELFGDAKTAPLYLNGQRKEVKV